MSRATKPYRKARAPQDWELERRDDSGAPLAVVDGYDEEDIDDSEEGVLLLTLHGQLRLSHDAEPALWRIIDEHAELDKLVKPRLGKIIIKRTTTTLTRSRWGQLHRGLLLVAGLAWEGNIHISCTEWDSCINATGDPPPARPHRTPTSQYPTTRRRERPKRK